MVNQTISKLSRQLRSADGRLDAIDAMDSIESFGPELSEEIVDDLVFALEAESSAYTRLRILGALEQLAQDCPSVASRATETVARMLNDSIDKFEGEDVSENREVSRETKILEAVLNRTTLDTGEVNLDYHDVRVMVQDGNANHRAIAYRLLGRAGTGEAIRILLRDFSHELQTVKDAREAGLDSACSLVISSLDAGGPLSRIETIDSFSELWAAGRLTPNPSQLDTIRREVFASVETIEKEQRATLLSAIERLARQDETTAERIVSEVLGVLTKDPKKQTVMWNVLRACAEGAPTVVLEHADEIAAEIDRGYSDDIRVALEVISVASRSVSAVPAVLAPPVLGLIDSTDTKTAKAAIDTIGTMGFYPVPDRLNDLVDQDHPSLSQAASRARKNLRKNRSVSGWLRDLRSGETDSSLFAGDSGDVQLKVRNEEGYWTDVTLGPLREGMVETTTHRLAQDENVPVVYPYYEPSDVVVLTLAVVLDDPSDDRQVGLYSPGSQTQWGMKGQIREKLREFGLADVSGEVIDATPIPEIVPDAYVSEGRVKDHSDGDGPGRIVLTKAVSELTAASDLDIVLLNLTAKTRMDMQDEVEALERELPQVDVVSAYSYYTRNENEGRPRYGPPTGLAGTPTIPGPDLVDAALNQSETSSGQGDRSPRNPSQESGSRTTAVDVFGDDDWVTGDDDVLALSQEKDIRIDHVETTNHAALFDQVFEESAKLFDTDASGSGGLIFSRQMFFERLPIPPDDFDEWVRKRYEEGDRFVPPLVRERIGDVQRKADTVENLEAVQPLNTAKQLLDRIHDQLRDQNPLFERLQAYITEAKATDESLAIFSTSPKNAQLLRDTIVKYDLVSRDDLDSGPISVVSPGEAKTMEPHDTLLVFGSLHPENAGFYVHPRVDETVVVTYDRTWATMIERHAAEFVTLLNDVIGESGYTPYAEPTLTGNLPEPDEDITEEPAIEEAPTPSPSAGESSAKSKIEIVEDAMRSASATEYGEEAGRYERELRRYIIETAAGERLSLTNRENVLRQSPSSDGGDIHWINPDSLSVGDTIVTIPDDIEKELWRDHLRDFYEDDFEADTAIERVQTWQDALVEIWDRVSQELNADGEISEMELHRRLHGWISEETDAFDRALGTVRSWFESAREADSPMDLVQNPSFIIGPQTASDIAAIGEAFGYETLTREAEAIQGAMRGLRTINRQEGHKYRDSIRDRLNSDKDTRVSETSSHRDITAITVADENEEPHNGELPDDLDADLVQRVIDIVELAPTSNGELAETWGYDSGSEVYQFLSSSLDAYYERNEKSMIVPTDEGRRAASAATDGD